MSPNSFEALVDDKLLTAMGGEPERAHADAAADVNHVAGTSSDNDPDDASDAEPRLRIHPTLHVCGLSHDRAPIELREKFALGPDRVVQTLRRLREEGRIREALVLSTCNRTEIYVFSPLEESFSAALEEFFMSLSSEPIGTHQVPLYSYESMEAVRHLLAVCSGLDSMILGENEIKAQVQQAFDVAKTEGLAGPNLHRLIEATHKTAKRIKTETDLNTGTLSVGRAAILETERRLGSLEGKVCVVIGAGKVGRVAAMAIAERKPSRLILINRTIERAQEVAEGLNAEILPIPRIAEALQQADMVLGAAFAPNFLVTKAMFEAVRRGMPARPVILVDTAVPRILDQEIGVLDGVTLIDISHLETIVAENRARRLAAAQRGWLIIEDEMEKLRGRIKAGSIGPIVERLRAQFDLVFTEMEPEILGASTDENELRRLRDAQRRLKQKLLHTAISELKSLHVQRK